LSRFAVDRRTLMVGGGAAAGLVIAFAVWPRSQGSALLAPEGGAAFDHYLTVAPDGRVTVAIPQVETGQGAWTALAQIAADELGADWSRVAVTPAPASPVYDNALLAANVSGADEGRLQITAGSTSVRAFEAPLRHAGAVARTMLCAAAADRWNVAAAECDTRDGFVVHEGKRLPFGPLAAAAAGMSPPERPVLRVPGSGALSGKALERIDLPPKTDGTFRLAADVRLPGMLFASVRLAPRGGRLSGHRPVRGARLVAEEGWLAALASSWWAAEQALVAAAPRFTAPVGRDSDEVERALRGALLHGTANTLFERGDVAAAAADTRPLAAVYEAEPAAHQTLEPVAATARFADGRLEVWAGTAAPDPARRAAAEAGRVSVAQTTLYPLPVGDQSGRAVEHDAVPIAVTLARRAGRPVQLILSREQGLRHDRPRAPMLARMSAVATPAGTLNAWTARVAGIDALGSTVARLAGGKSASGFAGLVPGYGIPSVRVEQVVPDLPFDFGYLRGGSEALAAFATESFIDELARAMGAEPLAFRIAKLGSNLRLARALNTAAALAGWDGGGPGSSMGIAGVEAFGSFIGLVASANLGPEGRIAVTRLVAAVDCGRLINPALVRQQIEGGLIAGLAQASAARSKLRFGQVVAGPPRLPRMAGTPRIDVELLPSTAASGGVSGLGAVALAPALANALAAATGRRLRKLPLDPMGAA
jgi:isoquinoline 1-oxidoreductase beta subunit